MNSKEIQIGSAKVMFNNEDVISRCESKWQVILKDWYLSFKKDNIIGEVLS